MSIGLLRSLGCPNLNSYRKTILFLLSKKCFNWASFFKFLLHKLHVTAISNIILDAFV